MKVIGTGLTGLVGSRIVELLSPDYEFEHISLDHGIDITNFSLLDQFFSASSADWVFHFAAYTDVDKAEKERHLKQDSLAWRVNVTATDNIAGLCRKYNKKLLYISTDFVFSGDKDSYSENDIPNPQGWYAITKYQGELSVGKLNDSLILRIAFPYKAHNSLKLDFVHKIVDFIKSGKTVFSPTDQLIVPTFIDDLALSINKLIQNQAAGIYHVVGSQAISPYQASILIARAYHLNEALVQKTSYYQFYKNRAPRPLHAVLKNDKITGYGVNLTPFKIGLSKISQMDQEVI